MLDGRHISWVFVGWTEKLPIARVANRSKYLSDQNEKIRIPSGSAARFPGLVRGCKRNQPRSLLSGNLARAAQTGPSEAPRIPRAHITQQHTDRAEQPSTWEGLREAVTLARAGAGASGAVPSTCLSRRRRWPSALGRRRQLRLGGALTRTRLRLLRLRWRPLRLRWWLRWRRWPRGRRCRLGRRWHLFWRPPS